jgi:hypothetical protein
LINASPRSEHTCPSEMSKSFRLMEIAQNVFAEGQAQVDVLDLSRLTSEYGRQIHLAKRAFQRSKTGVLMSTVTVPRSHHLDRHGIELAAGIAEGDPDELLPTKIVAGLLHLSYQWLQIGRHAGYGPPYVRLTPRVVRYRRRDLVEWLRSRASIATAPRSAPALARRYEVGDEVSIGQAVSGLLSDHVLEGIDVTR